MTTPPRPAPDLVAGRVGRPHGLDGSFRVVDAVPGLLAERLAVTVAGRSHEIVRRAGTAERPILRLAGFDGREAAEALRGEALLVPRERAPELGEDEFWAADLEGCRVHDGEHEVGEVRRLVAYPSVEVLEVVRATGGADLLVPLVRDAVRRIDVEGRTIDVDLGFLGER